MIVKTLKQDDAGGDHSNFLGFIRLFGGISKCLKVWGFTEAWLQSDLSRASEKPPAENLSLGLTRSGRIGDQDILWQVASQQSLPPLLLAGALQKNDVSPCKHGAAGCTWPKWN